MVSLEQRIRGVEQGAALLPLPGVPDRRAPLASRMLLRDTPGVGIAVIHDGGLEWARGYGVKRVNAGGTVTERTLFQAASISKAVTALAVMSLVQEGRLHLDADVNSYLTSWQVPANDSWQPVITLRQLLSHTAGTSVHGFPGYRRGRPVPTLPQVLDGEPPANTDPVRVGILPGVQFRYSGGGTSIVQQALVDVVGLPFPQLIRELVFEPLGMRDSTYEQPLPERRWADAADGHRFGGEPVRGGWHVYPEMAAAGLWTTPSDVAQVALEVQRVRAGEQGRLLTAGSVAQMLTPVAPGPVGIGFFLSGDPLRFGHGGDNMGFKCELAAYADHSLGAVVMTNGDGGWGLHQEVLGAIAREYDWPLSGDDSVGTYSPPGRYVPLDGSVYESYAGTYELRPDLRVRITASKSRLFLEAPGQQPVELLPESDTRYRARAVRLRVTFDRDEGGAVSGVALHQSDEEMRAEKVG